MAYTLLTLADIKQSVADRHDNGVVPTNSTVLARYVRLINRGIAYCADKLRISKPVTLAVTSGVADLPDDFILANSVFIGLVECLKVDPEDSAVHFGPVYWITGNQTDGFVLNTPTDGSYVVNYAFRPSPLSSNTDICIIPDIEAVSAYAYAMLRKGESDPFEDADKSLQECDSRIREMASANAINSDAIGFTMDFEQNQTQNWFTQL
jgi:hypothetical protein